MNTKEMIITPPEGWEIDVKKSNLSEQKIVYKEIKKKYKLPEEIEGFYVDDFGKVKETARMSTTGCGFSGVYPTKELCEASIALAKLLWWLRVYNGDWEPDWNDTLRHKFAILTAHNKVVYDEPYEHNAVLVFKTEEVRDKFFNNSEIKPLLETAKPLL